MEGEESTTLSTTSTLRKTYPSQVTKSEKETQQLYNYKLPLFLLKLYEIVSDQTTDDIVSWEAPQCEKFIIHNPSSFSQEVLPKYFKRANFPSFIRQLNLYDFRKLNRKQKGQVFVHPYFKKDEKTLLHKINRKFISAKEKDSSPDISDFSGSEVEKKREAKLKSKYKKLDLSSDQVESENLI